MSTPSEKFESTPRWAVTMTVGGTVALLIWGLFGFVLTAPSLFVLPEVYPLAGDFLVIAVLGYVLGMIGFLDQESSQNHLSEFLTVLNNHGRRERVYIVATLFLSAVAAVNVQVGVAAVISAQIGLQFGAPIIAIAAAFLIPPVDNWLGRNVGVSVAVMTLRAAISFMVLVSILMRVSREAPRAVNRVHPLSPKPPRAR